MTHAYSWEESQSNLPFLPPSTLTCCTKLLLSWKLITKHCSKSSATIFYLCLTFLVWFLRCLTCATSLSLEVPHGFLPNVISSILGNENSTIFQVGSVGLCQATEGIIAVGLRIWVIATKYSSNQCHKTPRHSSLSSSEWIYSSWWHSPSLQ